MRKAVCPGSFDPVTNGHLDVVERAAQQFDEVVVVVTINRNKNSMFTVDERKEMLRDGAAALPNVTVDAFHGLLVDYCRSPRRPGDREGPAGGQRLRLRAADGADEPPAQQRGHACSCRTNPDSSFLSSSLVKEVAMWGGDVSGLVPEAVLRRLTARVVRPQGTAT